LRIAREEGIKTLVSASAAAYTGLQSAATADRAPRDEAKGPSMADLLVVVTVLAFFGLCVAFVWGCDKIIGPDEHDLLDEARSDETDADLPAEAVGA
jgi:hypothetical protein